MNHLLTTATSGDEQRRAARLAVLPVGSFEQHGDHLPLTTDTLIACAIAREIADTYPVLLLPPITVSCSHEHAAWAGTVSISAPTLYAVVNDIYASVTAAGPTALAVVNGHGGNYVLGNAVQEANAQGRHMALYPAKEDWEEARTAAHLTSSTHEDMHAGELETSILLHTHPDLVRPGNDTADHTAHDRRHLPTTGLHHYTKTGVIGRPSQGTAEKGKIILDSLTRNFAKVAQLLST
ncbi:creatininase family protein [Allonocardiopsis opalescens]|uniref:Creatinine amidohydrolase n=1 Tax=Allonocardiopsis opalescens TaxID=1144618 RepID=A0A2T0Q882_9ACTN|nr:creatininase family protein [Allonocardiopsis opalescens]PRY00058.1 creatinine amidohydrolase [Allonocardiopsis opalescens]